MLKKILITVSVIFVLLLVAYFYLDHRNRSLSPRGEASLSNAGLTVEVVYSRPSVRDRLIFGTEEDGALVPYGNYWRLGANEATEVTFDRDVLFNGQEVKKGTYRIYAIPGEKSFEVRLSSDVGQWGAFEPDYELDVLSTTVPVKENPPTEQFTISLEEAENGVDMIITWARVRLEIPVRIG